ncbi:hypothetical protein GUJ93_ZPchr0001g29296 [Zizania palustris]|uniref:P-type ATPase C-terminal domain-containing protein n=1 Tax=Zizania palustris TaxID=103762 RepID=A0A8J5SB76_ZIZPA|nr:hypothetical protein GUJ93_ZPchr0001g29296 [Zizania palustris]
MIVMPATFLTCSVIHLVFYQASVFSVLTTESSFIDCRCYFFYMNISFGLTIFCFEAFVGFFGQSVYDDSLMLLFNVLMSLPIISLGVFERDEKSLPAISLLEYLCGMFHLKSAYSLYVLL